MRRAFLVSVITLRKQLRLDPALFLTLALCGIVARGLADDAPISAERFSPQDKALLARLSANWESQRKAILTAHLKCEVLWVRTVAMSRDEFLQLLASADLVVNPGNFKMLSKKLSKPLDANMSRLGEWKHVELWQDGDCNCETTHFEGKEGFWTISVTTDEKVWYDAINQHAGIFPVGDKRSLMPDSVNGYWHMPPSVVEDAASITRSNGDIIIARSKSQQGYSSKLVVDKATGMARSTMIYNPADEMFLERTQQQFVTYPCGVSYPRLFAAAAYEHNVLSEVKIAVVAEAMFNEEVPSSVFVVPVSKGTTIADYRDPSISTFRLTKDVADVLKVTAPSSPALAAKQAAPSTRWGALAASGGGLILLVGLLLVRIARRRRIIPN